MSIPLSIETGFLDPGLRAWRLMPTGNILLQLKLNRQLGRETNLTAAHALESYKETMYKLSVHDDYLASTEEKVKQLNIARQITFMQRNMGGVSDHMVKQYDAHIRNIDWLLKTFNQGWAQQMFPMLDHANIYPRKEK
tara:strand:+ start:325 stop:738 length:414 start_codon:yes stop_codon:yes gene_type:complete